MAVPTMFISVRHPFQIEASARMCCQVAADEPRTLSFAISFHDEEQFLETMEAVPLGKFLADFHLTADDCRAALEHWHSINSAERTDA